MPARQCLTVAVSGHPNPPSGFSLSEHQIGSPMRRSVMLVRLPPRTLGCFVSVFIASERSTSYHTYLCLSHLNCECHSSLYTPIDWSTKLAALLSSFRMPELHSFGCLPPHFSAPLAAGISLCWRRFPAAPMAVCLTMAPIFGAADPVIYARASGGAFIAGGRHGVFIRPAEEAARRHRPLLRRSPPPAPRSLRRRRRLYLAAAGPTRRINYPGLSSPGGLPRAPPPASPG